MTKFFSLGYWTNMYGGELIAHFRYAFIVLTIILLILAIIFTILQKRYKKTLYRKVYGNLQIFAIINFIIALFLLFFTDQGIPLLSARFWFLLFGVEMLVWLYFVAKIWKKIPGIEKKIAEEREYKKYIP